MLGGIHSVGLRECGALGGVVSLGLKAEPLVHITTTDLAVCPPVDGELGDHGGSHRMGMGPHSARAAERQATTALV